MKQYRNNIFILLIIYLLVLPNTRGQNTPTDVYHLKNSDFLISASGISVILFDHYVLRRQKTLTYEKLKTLNKKDINKFDRSASNQHNTNLHKASEWTRAASIALPLTLIAKYTLNRQNKEWLVYSTLYLETGLITIGITNLSKSLSNRIRPYLYNTDINMSEKEKLAEKEDVFDSFFSGHTSSAFASAVFFSKTYTDLFGKSNISKTIWITSLTLATTTGVMRYFAGDHYPTDIITGAITGSCIGYMIPVFHKKKSKNATFIIFGNSIYLSYMF